MSKKKKGLATPGKVARQAESGLREAKGTALAGAAAGGVGMDMWALALGGATLGFLLKNEATKQQLRRRLVSQPRLARRLAKRYRGTRHEPFFRNVVAAARKKAVRARKRVERRHARAARRKRK